METQSPDNEPVCAECGNELRSKHHICFTCEEDLCDRCMEICDDYGKSFCHDHYYEHVEGLEGEE